MRSSTSTRVFRAIVRARQAIPQSLPRALPAVPRPSAAPAQLACLRSQFHTASPRLQKQPPKEYEGGTNFGELDVLGNTPTPSTSIDVCMSDGFALNSGVKILDGNAALLVGGEAFEWRPWEAKGSMNLINAKGQFEVPPESFGVLDLLWPKPDLLIIGVGPKMVPLSPATKKYLSSIGIRVEVLDTRNAASQFNLLATERGVDDVAGALIPIGWVEGKGAA
ncbi:NADH dehydrogenase [ubiquinone] 1 alpha subcomplex assembly factor 3 [Colletotrichum orbiculare MAFF 240422]|uniref:NADH dehydrogenase [ubiquinone] 1 alpha subcomplex assembly factor 3 n=1 Tax=Colletotrichum orbiculare (strain 104-T / ATCC 96160 / CBS 514.97 / LARS 414 / MAFF 240422) TaxID=1213857 RepID=N4VGU9_COLOR|nr:NADH dehydrogenase [ubiquinone] 1 alpha subcomplex assembly factor 3 [Colletotrichum orbiculare MAFF 240422]